MTPDQSIRSGDCFARNAQMLAEQVAGTCGILLIHAKAYDPRLSIAVRLESKIIFFERMAELLGAHVHIRESLRIIECGSLPPAYRMIVRDCREGLEEGLYLSEVARYHALLFEDFVVQLLAAGERTGQLAATCARIAAYYRSLQKMFVAVRSAVIVPLITLGVACVLVPTVICFMMPRLMAMQRMVHHQGHAQITPSLMQRAYEMMMTPWFWLIVGVALLALLRWVWRMVHGKMSVQAVLIRIPYVRRCAAEWMYATFMRSAGMALVGGVDMATALSCALGEDGSTMHVQYASVRDAVMEGHVFSEALCAINAAFVEETRMRAVIGEATGTLGAQLIAAAEWHETRCLTMLARWSAYVQPALIVLIGCIIGGVVMLLYEPLVTMSERIL